MSTPNMAPGKWSISPEWVTGSGTSGGFGAGYSSESFYYYAKKKPKPTQAEADTKPAVESVGEAYVKYIAEKFKEK